MPSPGENSGIGGGFLPRPTVLVVDDEPLIRWALAEAIGDAGYPVEVAATGADAEQAVSRLAGQPLVVLLDLRLPDVVDLSLLRALRVRRPDVPVLVLSAWATVAEAEAALSAGATRVLKKPFDVSLVVAAVGAASPSSTPSYTR